ncbi:MAG: DUF1343 domain-containing protein [Armatimonadetes bacterium]|nr:DUF1343 domain-containing protein [Armatimonadota bacterium]
MTQVLTGIDVLEREGFAPLRGRRVGLVTNHTGLARDGRTTIDVLHRAKEVELAALFGPEHGIRGEKDERVADGTDAKTGLPVYSLYGAREKPTPEQLRDVDTLVFDIQDIGCRFYTYISTLGNVMEAAGEQGLRVVVLDRPNPITGQHVEGPLADEDKLSFTAYHPLPVRHGMTVGELARLFHAERGLSCPLDVVPCEGWRRGDWYDATGLLWTDPSPNMRALMAAALYPGVGLLEMTNLSVGRGTDAPFELVGAPFMDAHALAAALNAERLPGVRCYPVRFTPRASRFAGESCGGVRLLVTDREALDAVRVGLTLAAVLRRLYPQDWQHGKLLTLLANQKVFDAVAAGADYRALVQIWDADLREFLARRARFLLYL